MKILSALPKWVTSFGTPDVVIGEDNDPYLKRYYIIPRNRWCNLYLHQFIASDDERALHDHMYFSASLMLWGAYIEHTIRAGGVHRRERIEAGALRLRSPWSAHRIELEASADGRPRECWTLFLTGPRLRPVWGFHCPDAGWIPWHRFVADDDAGVPGRGCEQ